MTPTTLDIALANAIAKNDAGIALAALGEYVSGNMADAKERDFSSNVQRALTMLKDMNKNYRAQIAELEAQVVVWHPYPAERPNPNGFYLIPLEVEPHRLIVDLDYWQWSDTVRGYWRERASYHPGSSGDIHLKYWAELPQPPRDGDK